MIRYDKNLNTELYRTVHNYNAKIARLESKGIETDLEKVSIRSIKREFTERKDLLSYIREMRKLSQRGVQRVAFLDRYKNAITEYDLSVARIRQARAIRMAERKLLEAKKVIRTLGGEKEVESLMGTDYESNLQANLERLKENKFSRKLTKFEQASIVRSGKTILNFERSARRGRGNFFEMLDITGDFAGVSKSKIAYIRDKFGSLDANTWEKVRNGEELVVAIMENYPRLKDATSKEEKQVIKEELSAAIERLYESVDSIVDYYTGE